MGAHQRQLHQYRHRSMRSRRSALAGPWRGCRGGRPRRPRRGPSTSRTASKRKSINPGPSALAVMVAMPGLPEPIAVRGHTMGRRWTDARPSTGDHRDRMVSAGHEAAGAVAGPGRVALSVSVIVALRKCFAIAASGRRAALTRPRPTCPSAGLIENSPEVAMSRLCLNIRWIDRPQGTRFPTRP